MAVPYPREFLNLRNFQLAWDRIVRGSNSQYKRFFSHLFPSYQIASPALLLDLISRLRRGIYVPSNATTVYFPKPTRILRPITLLCINDQIVYQAIANYLADKFFKSLRPNYGVKTFGAQYAGKNSQFFYRPWKKAYREFNSSIKANYLNGSRVIADFDLVSFFDLIDHEVLRRVLETRVKRGEVLELLIACLKKWTSGSARIYVRGHGIPQGPEPSAFLAEILLTDFDRVAYRKVTYLRYVDDIKLLAKDFSPARRALLKLDLQAKRLGLVPQAQKIEVRRVTDINSELKTVPSSIAGATSPTRLHALSKSTIRRLTRLLRNSVGRRKGEIFVRKETHFKFALHRLPPSRRILRLVEPLIYSRPDLSTALAHFILRFTRDARVAALLHKALMSDPVFDAAAGEYVLALDKCAPRPEPRKYRRAVSKLMGRSEEKSILLDVPRKLYRYKRMGKSGASVAIQMENNPLAAGQLIHFLISDPRHAFLSARDLRQALSRFANYSPDEDLARFCTYLMLAWLKLIPRSPRAAGVLILRYLGHAAPPATYSFLTGFFKDIFGLPNVLDWERRLGKNAHSELQRRAIAIRGGWTGNPSILVTTLDSFNDLLIQRFSRKHKALKKSFRKAAGRKAKIPDFGNWLQNASLQAVLPKSSLILLECHRLRVKAEIAHATDKKTGRFTRPVSYYEREQITKKLKSAYLELLQEWAKT
jgi:hypothetical protein